jgi:hypothetical protein
LEFGQRLCDQAFELFNAVRLEHVVIGGFAVIAHGPLDYETVAVGAVDGSLRGSPFRVAGLRSIVGLKRLANRSQGRVDLEALERANGELPIVPIPGLDK